MTSNNIHNFKVDDLVRVPVLGIRDGLFKIVKFETIPGSSHPVAVVAYHSGTLPTKTSPQFYHQQRVALFRLKAVPPLEQLALQAGQDNDNQEGKHHDQ